MPLRVTIEEIDGAIVKRYNGNNPAGTAEARGSSRTGARAAYLTAAQKKKAKKRKQAESYQRRFLDG